MEPERPPNVPQDADSSPRPPEPPPGDAGAGVPDALWSSGPGPDPGSPPAEGPPASTEPSSAGTGAVPGEEPQADGWRFPESQRSSVDDPTGLGEEPARPPWESPGWDDPGQDAAFAPEPRTAASVEAVAASPEGPAAVAAAVDPLDRVCPYLRSVDGTWRNSVPDPDHRCGSQVPPATLPLLAQERFCLTEDHVRCEWFKMAEAERQRALQQDGIPEDRVQQARFRPAVRSTPLVLDSAASDPSGGRRRLPPVALAIGGFVIVVLVALAILVIGAGTASPAPSPTPTVAASAPSPAASPSVPASAAASVPPASAVASAPPATAGPTPFLVIYEVQDNERMAKIAEKFGITKEAIIAVNDLGDPPRVEVGQRIVLPLPPGSTLPPGSSPVPEAP